MEPSITAACPTQAQQRPDPTGRLREIVAMLREVTGEDEEWCRQITETTRLDDDLRMESQELTALSTLLHERYGDSVDLTAYLAGLDIDEIIELTVGDLLSLVADR